MDAKTVLNSLQNDGVELADLGIDKKATGDIVLFGAVNDNKSFSGRQEFALRGEEQDKFLLGIVELLKNK